jgi:hypothetical protein
MGFFSWMTQDTDRSIPSNYSNRPTFPVDMIDDKGNVWHEPNYDGYGVFGGKDYYELLSEMNGGSSDRGEGITMAFKDSPSGDNPNLKFPNLVETAKGWYYQPLGPESCPDQGFFYNDDDEDSWDEEEDELTGERDGERRMGEDN